MEKKTDSTPSDNLELKLARDFVQYTASHIFLTGKAGTGKTTFLHQLKGNTAKRMIITAPTGVAAINAGGVTLHSFFQLPFGPFIPGSEAYENNSRRMFRFSREKKQIIQSLNLLVIDEISMVRADLLDSVDAVLRRHRRNDMPFGGVQLLMIGDLHQLSPVAKEHEWRLLQEYYESVYFFSSHALGRAELVTIELKHIYRQSDAGFIKLLNRVRDNRLDAAAFEKLNQRYIQGFTPEQNQGYITLTTHNNRADRINKIKLDALKGQSYYFDAEVSGDFPEHTYPAPARLLLKEDAQVMFLRNDAGPEKRYYNGKTGRIKTISQEQITIICPGESWEITVEPVRWDNIKYSVNKENMEIQEEIIGTFQQFPLKPAWAITIHKSQGLTFDKAVIDAQSAFSHGQVYVALSRCKTFEGMVLSSPIPPEAVETDPAVLSFVEEESQNPPSEKTLLSAKISYQQKLVMECFDCQPLYHRMNYLTRIVMGNARLLHVSGVSDMGLVQNMFREKIFMVSEKFKQQLRNAFAEDVMPESDDYILDRTAKASKWFQEQFALIFEDFIQKLHIETDNREIGKKAGYALNYLKQEIVVKLAGIQSCKNGFSPTRYLQAILRAEMEFKPETNKQKKPPAYGESDIEHPELFQELKDWRFRKARENNVPQFQILHQRILIQIAVRLPGNSTVLGNISGVGPKTLEKYGKDILKLVGDYRKKHGIDKVIPPPLKAETTTGASYRESVCPSDTKQISFDMFNKGLPIADISRERGLVMSTIEGHLCFFVENGKLDINKVLPAEKQDAIESAISRKGADNSLKGADNSLKGVDNSLKAIKDELGDDYSYGEIKLILAHKKYLTSNAGTCR